MTVSGEIVVVDDLPDDPPDPPPEPTEPPKYAAVLIRVRDPQGFGFVGGVAQVDGVFVAHNGDTNAVRVTPLGRSVGYVVVDPGNYPNLDLAQVLRTANSGTGTTDEGIRVTLITVPSPRVHPNVYGLEYARDREISL